MRSSGFLAAAAAALLLFIASFAFAHDDAYLATLKAPHGGELRMAGPYHYELVAGVAESDSSGNAIAVYVTDHAGNPVSTKGARGVVRAAGRKGSSVELVPDGGNRMKAGGSITWMDDATVIVSITVAGAQPAQAQFMTRATGTPGSAHSPAADAGHRH